MLLKEHGGPLTDKQKKMLQEAERSCERIGAVVAELSELGKLESHELAVARQELDLAALLRDVASDMHASPHVAAHSRQALAALAAHAGSSAGRLRLAA